MKTFRFQVLDKETSRVTWYHAEAKTLAVAMRSNPGHKKSDWQVLENGVWVWCGNAACITFLTDAINNIGKEPHR